MFLLLVHCRKFQGFVPVTDEDDQGQAVTELVRTGRGLGGIGSGHFVQEPVRGRTKALLVLLTVKIIAVSWYSRWNLQLQQNFPTSRKALSQSEIRACNRKKRSRMANSRSARHLGCFVDLNPVKLSKCREEEKPIEVGRPSTDNQGAQRTRLADGACAMSPSASPVPGLHFAPCSGMVCRAKFSCAPLI